MKPRPHSTAQADPTICDTVDGATLDRIDDGIAARRRERRRAALRMWLAFDATMLFLRALTSGQRTGILPVPDVEGGGIHVHHFVWGIVILGVVAFCGLMSESAAANTKLALLFGVGTGLLADEFALWLTLHDVYFAPEGVWSIEVASLISAVLAANFVLRCERTNPRLRIARGVRPEPAAAVMAGESGTAS